MQYIFTSYSTAQTDGCLSQNEDMMCGPPSLFHGDTLQCHEIQCIGTVNTVAELLTKLAAWNESHPDLNFMRIDTFCDNCAKK